MVLPGLGIPRSAEIGKSTTATRRRSSSAQVRSGQRILANASNHSENYIKDSDQPSQNKG